VDPSRRTFLFLGAAAGVGLVLPGTPAFHDTTQWIRIDGQLIIAGRRGGKNAFLAIQQSLNRQMFVAGRRGGKNDFLAAMQQEMQAIVADHRRVLNAHRLRRLEDLRTKWANRPRVTAGALRSPLFADSPRLPRSTDVSEPSAHLPV
jgi:hypothetical protein